MTFESTPQFPVSLPGSFWGLTTFFNPQGYKNPLVNYRLFRDSLSRQGLSLLTVECAFGERPFELQPSDADIVVQIRSQSVLWQKERLLNVGLQRLPADCDKIAWLDADILFQNNAWVGEIAELLQRYVVVQPYSFVEWLPKKDSNLNALSSPPEKHAKYKTLHGIGYGVAHQGKRCFEEFARHGHTGFAWAARRILFEQHGFYDRDILGTGDLLMAYAFYGFNSSRIERKLSAEGLLGNYVDWTSKLYGDVGGSVYYLNGKILHLWHGFPKDRRYESRNLGKELFAFDPKKDIRVGASGCWEWASDKPGLHQWTAKYFSMRNEDNAPPKVLTTSVKKPGSLALEVDRWIGLFGILLKEKAPTLYSFLKGSG